MSVSISTFSCAAVLPLLLLGASAVHSATITVNNTSDGSVAGQCTLRDAVVAANTGAAVNGCTAGSGSDTIVFDPLLNPKTISVATGEITISTSMVIDGGGRITLDAQSNNRIFSVNVPFPLLMTLKGLKLVNGDAGSGDGGAIFVDPTADVNLQVQQSEFLNNRGANGGAIASLATQPASVVAVDSSTFSGNQATGAGSSGGAILSASYTVVGNSTFIGNQAGVSGGAIATNGLDASHLSMVNNTAPVGSSVVMQAGIGTINNSLIVNDSAPENCAFMPGSTLSGSYNLEWDEDGDGVTCGTTTNQISGGTDVNAIVATALANHGGPTRTLMLPVGSPAIGAADPNVGGTSQMFDTLSVPSWIWSVDATLDQRGSARKPVTAGRDIGAFEANALVMAPGTLPAGTINAPYPAVPLSTTGGTAPYVYSTPDTLPPGMSLSPAGVISGTPTTSGSYTLVVTVVDSSGALTATTYTLLVRAAASATAVPALDGMALVLLSALALLAGLGWMRKHS